MLSIQGVNRDSSTSITGKQNFSQGNDAMADKVDTNRCKESSRMVPFSVTININVAQLLLLIAALFSRLYQLGHPWAVVFDELHYFKYVTLYMKQIFFFDLNPPLGKLIFAFVASFLNYSGDGEYENIGAEYSKDIPVYQLRLVPAICGSLIVPLVYQIVVEIGLSHWTALGAALLVLLDNALLVQSRFILLDSILMFFMTAAFVSALKFRKLSKRPFTGFWWFYLAMTAVFVVATVSTKYIGLATYFVVLYILFKDYWSMISDDTKSILHLVKEFTARFFGLIVLPVILYISIFYVHLSILTKAGPHFNVMSSVFQASLEGGLASITKGQPSNVAYGSQITLRHTHGHPCWLHSHPHVYPIKYESGLGSSHQQQVTCYYFKDVNNWWIVKHPDKNQLLVEDPPELVKHGDLVQLVHGITHRALNSHDVAAPASPECQEVSCYIDYNISMATQNLWRVEITNRGNDKDTWQTINSIVKLIHVNTSAALKVSWKILPDWGFQQLEVVADRDVSSSNTLWNVEEHRYSRMTSDERLDLSEAELIPTAPTKLSFWDKFSELQFKMMMAQTSAVTEHRYSSTPFEWPFVTRTVAYWLSSHNNAQIHLLANPLVWYAASLSLPLSMILVTLCAMRRRRQHFDITEESWQKLVFVQELCIGGYILHFIPFLITDDTLFVYHYLPLVIFKVISLGALIQHLYEILPRSRRRWRICFQYSVLAYLTMTLWSFIELSVFSYGTMALTPHDIARRQWKDTWDFIIHK